MDKNSLVNKWLEHCKKSGHITQSEAMDRGEKFRVGKYATYTIRSAPLAIVCNVKKCRWKFRPEKRDLAFEIAKGLNTGR